MLQVYRCGPSPANALFNSNSNEVRQRTTPTESFMSKNNRHEHNIRFVRNKKYILVQY